jgi:hypothetical protein
MQRPNRDATAEITQTLAVIVKALEVIASLALLISKAINKLSHELVSEVGLELKLHLELYREFHPNFGWDVS